MVEVGKGRGSSCPAVQCSGLRNHVAHHGTPPRTRLPGRRHTGHRRHGPRSTKDHQKERVVWVLSGGQPRLQIPRVPGRRKAVSNVAFGQAMWRAGVHTLRLFHLIVGVAHDTPYCLHCKTQIGKTYGITQHLRLQHGLEASVMITKIPHFTVVPQQRKNKRRLFKLCCI